MRLPVAGMLLLPRNGGAGANRLRRRTSNQTVLGSNPAVAAALSPWTRLFTPIVPRRAFTLASISYLVIFVKYILAIKYFRKGCYGATRHQSETTTLVQSFRKMASGDG